MRSSAPTDDGLRITDTFRTLHCVGAASPGGPIFNGGGAATFLSDDAWGNSMARRAGRVSGPYGNRNDVFEHHTNTAAAARRERGHHALWIERGATKRVRHRDNSTAVRAGMNGTIAPDYLRGSRPAVITLGPGFPPGPKQNLFSFCQAFSLFHFGKREKADPPPPYKGGNLTQSPRTPDPPRPFSERPGPRPG